MQLPTRPSQDGFAGGQLKVSEGCPLDNLKFQKIILFHVFLEVPCSLQIEPVHGISDNMVCAASKVSDQPAHTRSLIRAFASGLSIL